MVDGMRAEHMAAAWRDAGTQLGIEVVAPFEVAGVSFAVHLPDFGGPRGMVIANLVPPSADGETVAASEAGLYLSRVADVYDEFDPDLFQAALNDWGWYGPADRRPAWYSGTAWTH